MDSGAGEASARGGKGGLASASAGDGLSAGENRLEIGPAVPAPGVVVFAAAEKIGQNQLLMAHFGRGGWRDRIVNGTVQEKVGRKWMVQWDFPSSSGSTTTLGHGGTFFTRHATRHDPGHARAHDQLSPAGAQDSSSDSSSDSFSGSSSDEDETVDPSSHLPAAAVARWSLNLDGSSGADGGPSATVPGAQASTAVAQSPPRTPGRAGQSPQSNPSRSFTRLQQRRAAHVFLEKDCVTWNVVQEGFTVDESARHQHFRPYVNWRGLGLGFLGEVDVTSCTCMPYVRAFLPPEWRYDVLRWTNLPIPDAQTWVQPWEFYVLCGVLVAFTILQAGRKRDLWSGSTKESFFETQKFGIKFGISYNGFAFLMSTLIFLDPTKHDALRDPWYRCRSIVDPYNRRVECEWMPGRQFCVDELIMEWDGKGAYDRNTVVGMPHVTKEARTPRDVRMEGKCCACALSSIISVFVLRAPQPRTCCRMEVNKIQFSTLIFAGIPPELAHLDLETLKVTFCALSRGTVDFSVVLFVS